MRYYVQLSGIRASSSAFDIREIVLVFYGTRGGYRSSESLTVEQARELRDQLSAVLEQQDADREFCTIGGEKC